MSKNVDAATEARNRRKVATGTWLYDLTVPMEITVWAKPARLAWSRVDDDENIDETKPIPETRDGFLYYYRPGGSGEYMTLEEAKAMADAEPWGPVTWD
ncbi:MAG TPA: hypothetical protein VKR59_03325 [Terriglobales bacterium]|nr:hypothetical protein [Terriglobales bacterium]